MERVQYQIKTKQVIQLLMTLWLFSGIVNILFISQVAAASNDPLRLDENIKPVVTSNEGMELYWEVKRSVGIFALEKYHIRDQIKLTIDSVNVEGRKYTSTQERFYWRDSEWNNMGQNISTSYFVLNREWKKSVKSEIILNASNYWCRHPLMLERWAKFRQFIIPGTNVTNPNGQDVLNYFVAYELEQNNLNPGSSYSFWEDDEEYAPDIKIYTTVVLSNYADEIFTTSKYDLEWQFSRYLTVTTFKITFDDKNFEIYRYTREEGILLSRETEINIENGTSINQPLTGSFRLVLIDFNKELRVSFYHYLIWFGIVFGSIMVAVLVISQLVAWRQRKLRMLDY